MKKVSRTLNPSTHVKRQSNHRRCMRQEVPCLLVFPFIYTTRKIRFTWIHGCRFRSLHRYFSFPFINSLSSSFLSPSLVWKTFTCVVNVIATAYRASEGRKAFRGEIKRFCLVAYQSEFWVDLMNKFLTLSETIWFVSRKFAERKKNSFYFQSSHPLYSWFLLQTVTKTLPRE